MCHELKSKKKTIEKPNSNKLAVNDTKKNGNVGEQKPDNNTSLIDDEKDPQADLTNKKTIEKPNSNKLAVNDTKKNGNVSEQKFDNNPSLIDDEKDPQADLTNKKTTENNTIETDKSIENYQQPTKSEIISISDELNLNTKFVEKTETKKNSQDWTESELFEQWTSFLKTLINQKKTSAYNVFQRTIPKKRNNVVEIEYYSQSEKFEFEELKSSLIEHLRSKLNNSELEITFIAKIQEGNDVVITKKDKYDFLLTKNKNLSKLIDKLELNPL